MASTTERKEEGVEVGGKPRRGSRVKSLRGVGRWMGERGGKGQPQTGRRTQITNRGKNQAGSFAPCHHMRPQCVLPKVGHPQLLGHLGHGVSFRVPVVPELQFLSKISATPLGLSTTIFQDPQNSGSPNPQNSKVQCPRILLTLESLNLRIPITVQGPIKPHGPPNFRCLHHLWALRIPITSGDHHKLQGSHVLWD